MRARLQAHNTTDRARPVLVWRAPRPVLTISSGAFGGGMGLRSWIVNAEVPKAYDRVDLADHASELRDELELTGDGVLLLTAASVDRHAIAEDGGAIATATVGLTTPTWAAAPDGDAGTWQPGTINVVAWVPVRMSLAALVGAIGTVTEAKVQALVEVGVPGSGTASDAVCVVCPAEGPVEPFAGVRSEWGARLARAVHAAVLTGAHPR